MGQLAEDRYSEHIPCETVKTSNRTNA